MFFVDGNMLYCFVKSVLMNILEKLLSDRLVEQVEFINQVVNGDVQIKVCIVDWMVEV